MNGVFPVENFRKQFPILHKPLENGKQLVYLDNCATTQRPQCIIDKITDFYSNYNSNVHRSMYDFSERATEKYEQTRKKAANYFGVKNADEIIFVHGTTEAINLVAHSYCKKFLKPGDEVLVGAAEHHANYLPWQRLEQDTGIKRKIIPLKNDLSIDLEAYQNLFSPKTKFVTIQHISNVLGTKNDIKKMSKIAHQHGARILVDGASSMAFDKLNLYSIDCDFFTCSTHKGFGPMGSGILFGKYDLLKQMPPYNTGGNIVNKVNFDVTTFKLPPYKFEAGTPDVAAVIGLGATIDFLNKIDWAAAKKYLSNLRDYCCSTLNDVQNLQIYGRPDVPIFSFNFKNIHCHDVATYLANEGIAIRAGTHCAQPLMSLLGCSGTARISMALYNTTEEIDFVKDTLVNCAKKFF